MRCPQCGSARLRVEVIFTGKVDCDFAGANGLEVLNPVSLDSAFGQSSECHCLYCKWDGTVAEAEIHSE